MKTARVLTIALLASSCSPAATTSDRDDRSTVVDDADVAVDDASVASVEVDAGEEVDHAMVPTASTQVSTPTAADRHISTCDDLQVDLLNCEQGSQCCHCNEDEGCNGQHLRCQTDHEVPICQSCIGEEGCPCDATGHCLTGEQLACNAEGTCIDCPFGGEGCLPRTGAQPCDDFLIEQGGYCVACEGGTAGCTPRDDGHCVDHTKVVDGRCQSCEAGAADCTPNEGTCNYGTFLNDDRRCEQCIANAGVAGCPCGISGITNGICLNPYRCDAHTALCTEEEVSLLDRMCPPEAHPDTWEYLRGATACLGIQAVLNQVPTPISTGAELDDVLDIGLTHGCYASCNDAAAKQEALIDYVLNPLDPASTEEKWFYATSAYLCGAVCDDEADFLARLNARCASAGLDLYDCLGLDPDLQTWAFDLDRFISLTSHACTAGNGLSPESQQRVWVEAMLNQNPSDEGNWFRTERPDGTFVNDQAKVMYTALNALVCEQRIMDAMEQ